MKLKYLIACALLGAILLVVSGCGDFSNDVSNIRKNKQNQDNSVTKDL